MNLQDYTLEAKRKAMIDAGHISYASLAREIGYTRSVVRRVIISDSPIRMRRIEAAILKQIGSYLEAESYQNREVEGQLKNADPDYI